MKKVYCIKNIDGVHPCNFCIYWRGFFDMVACSNITYPVCCYKFSLWNYIKSLIYSIVERKNGKTWK